MINAILRLFGGTSSTPREGPAQTGFQSALSALIPGVGMETGAEPVEGRTPRPAPNPLQLSAIGAPLQLGLVRAGSDESDGEKTVAGSLSDGGRDVTADGENARAKTTVEGREGGVERRAEGEAAASGSGTVRTGRAGEPEPAAGLGRGEQGSELRREAPGHAAVDRCVEGTDESDVEATGNRAVAAPGKPEVAINVEGNVQADAEAGVRTNNPADHAVSDRVNREVGDPVIPVGAGSPAGLPAPRPAPEASAAAPPIQRAAAPAPVNAGPTAGELEAQAPGGPHRTPIVRVHPIERITTATLRAQRDAGTAAGVWTVGSTDPCDAEIRSPERTGRATIFTGSGALVVEAEPTRRANREGASAPLERVPTSSMEPSAQAAKDRSGGSDAYRGARPGRTSITAGDIGRNEGPPPASGSDPAPARDAAAERRAGDLLAAHRQVADERARKQAGGPEKDTKPDGRASSTPSRGATTYEAAPIRSAELHGTDTAGRVDSIEALRDHDARQPLRRVSVRVGEGESAARVRVSVRGDAVQSEVATESERLANRMGRELPELRQSLQRQGLETDALRVRHADRVLASDVATARSDPGRSSDGHEDTSQKSGSRREAHDGRERSRDHQNQEGNE